MAGIDKEKIPELAFKAFKEAIRGVVKEHRRTGRPLSVWRNGKVMHVSADEVRQGKRKKS